MQSRPRILRASCTASNAFNSALAIRSALITPLHHKPVPTPATTPIPNRVALSFVRSFSITNVRNENGLATAPSTSSAKISSDQTEPSNSPTDQEAHQPTTNTSDAIDQGQHGQVVQPAPAFMEAKYAEVDHSRKWQVEMRRIATTAGELAEQRRPKIRGSGDHEDKDVNLDYAGFAIAPPTPHGDTRTPPPWSPSPDAVAGRFGDELFAEEIESFAKDSRLTPMERTARGYLVKEICQIARGRSHDDLCVLFGSDTLRLATHLSDLDFRLIQSKIRNPAARRKHLQWVYERLRESPDFYLVTIRDGKFPIINATHLHTRISVQIVDAPGNLPQQKFIQTAMRELPHLRKLYFFFHTVLNMRGLIDVFNGGIGSYGLLNMIIASITRPSSKPAVTLVEQARRFLDFWTELDAEKYGVSVSPPRLFKKHNGGKRAHIDAAIRRADQFAAGRWSIGQRRPLQPYLLCLQDGANGSNDLGRKTNAIKHIQATLSDIRADLQRNIFRGENLYAQQTSPRWITRLALGRPDLIYADRRRNLEEFGRSQRNSSAQLKSTAKITHPYSTKRLQIVNADPAEESG